MADQNLTSLTAILDGDVASTDVLYIVDVSGSADRKITVQELAQSILANLASGTVSETELGYLSSVTSDLQTQLNAKQATITDSDDITEGAANLFLTTAERSKLSGIETSADVTDAANVGSVNSSASSKATPVDADSFVIVNSESGNAIGRVTGTNLKSYLKTYFDTLYQDILAEGAFVDGDKTKLDGIETSADVTDTANVTAAGALMDSELTDLTAIKTLSAPDNTTISTFGATLVDDASASAARTTLDAATTSQTDFISGIIESPSDKDYKLIIQAPYAGTITSTTTQCTSGTCTATFKVNTTALGGTANSVSSTEVEQAHSTSNTFSAGDNIVMTISSNSSTVDMSFTIKYTYTLS